MTYVSTIWDQSVMLMGLGVSYSDTREFMSLPSAIGITIAPETQHSIMNSEEHDGHSFIRTLFVTVLSLGVRPGAH